MRYHLTPTRMPTNNNNKMNQKKKEEKNNNKIRSIWPT